MPTNPVNVGTRLASMFLDHFFMTMIMIVPMVPLMISTLSADLSNTAPTSTELFGSTMLYGMLVGMAIYLCKDSIGSRSLAKRIMKHQVLDSKSNLPATPLQCLVRNFFIVLWPVEVVMILINPAKRIGDRVAGTKVVVFNERSMVFPINYLQLVLCLVLALAFLYLVTISWQ